MAHPIHSRSIWLLPLISRPHPGPAAAAGGLARRGCSPRALCYPDPRARLLQARRGSWPGGGPADRRSGGGQASRRGILVAAGREGWWGRGGLCGRLPPKQEGEPSPSSARSSSNPAKAPAAIGSQPHRAH